MTPYWLMNRFDLMPLLEAWQAKADQACEDFKVYGETTLTGLRIANAYEECVRGLTELVTPR